LDAVTPPPLNTVIWVKLSGEFGEKVSSFKYDPASTTIDELKKLVKLECPSLMDGVDALMLEVKGADGSALRPGILLSSRPEGIKRLSPFIVEVPKNGIY
jgi:hypothetical protein